MISNSERREAAARLRESRDFISGLGGGAIPNNAFDTFERILECIDYEHGNIFDFLADLIDRPTCFDKESKNSKFFTCSACGFSDSQVAVNPFTLEIRYVKPSYNYCPNCGAEVVNDD